MTYLLDTDTCSHHLRRPAGMAARFAQFSGRIAVPTLVVAELYVWAYRLTDPSSRLSRLQELIEETTVLPFDGICAEHFGRVRGPLMNRGIVVPRIDMMIASVALVHDLTLVTHNTKDYRLVPGLRLADWIAA